MAEGYQAARQAGLNLLAVLKREVGDLDPVERIVKILGFVASAYEFHEQSSVIDGTSDLLVEVFEDKAPCALRGRYEYPSFWNTGRSGDDRTDKRMT